MKQERDHQKRRRIQEDENNPASDHSRQKADRGQGQQSSKSGQHRGQGQMGQPGSSGPNRPMDVDEEEEETRTEQRKRA